MSKARHRDSAFENTGQRHPHCFFSHEPRFMKSLNGSDVYYLGRGPHENYPDRKYAAHWGLYYTTPHKMLPSYIFPQESAYRCENEFLCISNKVGEGFKFSSNKDFGFSYLPYDLLTVSHTQQRDSTNMGHRENHYNILCIDSHMMGVGGIGSVSVKPKQVHQVGPISYEMTLYITAF